MRIPQVFRSFVPGLRPRRWMLPLAVSLGLLHAPAEVDGVSLFALTDTGELYSSIDQGVGWSSHSTLSARDAVALVAGETQEDLLLATRSGCVYRPADGGLTWTPVGAIPASDVADMSILTDVSLLALTTTGWVFASEDDGGSWSPLFALPASGFVSMTAAAGGRVYALTGTGEIYESEDAGLNWAAKGAVAVPDAVDIRHLGDSLFLLSSTGGIFQSVDQGESWTAVGTLSQSGMTSLVPLGGVLAASTGGGEVATSTDGTSWTWRGAVNQLRVVALATNEPVSAGVPASSARRGVELGAPWPNPIVNGIAMVPVHLAREEDLTLSLFTVNGRLIARRGPERCGEGSHTLSWNLPADVAAGIVLLRLDTASDGVARSRAVVLR